MAGKPMPKGQIVSPSPGDLISPGKQPVPFWKKFHPWRSPKSSQSKNFSLMTPMEDYGSDRRRLPAINDEVGISAE
jgi:hypothetical protein